MFSRTNCESTIMKRCYATRGLTRYFERRTLYEITRWKRINGGAPGHETRGKNERIALNDVCMRFVTRIIVDLFSCGLPRPTRDRI